LTFVKQDGAFSGSSFVVIGSAECAVSQKGVAVCARCPEGPRLPRGALVFCWIELWLLWLYDTGVLWGQWGRKVASGSGFGPGPGLGSEIGSAVQYWRRPKAGMVETAAKVSK
jgi:hypothetical protein